MNKLIIGVINGRDFFDICLADGGIARYTPGICFSFLSYRGVSIWTPFPKTFCSLNALEDYGFEFDKTITANVFPFNLKIELHVRFNDVSKQLISLFIGPDIYKLIIEEVTKNSSFSSIEEILSKYVVEVKDAYGNSLIRKIATLDEEGFIDLY